MAAYPLYGATFTAFRLSPLHHGDSTVLLTPAALQLHARRLGDRLKGDTLRGIHVAFSGPTTPGNTGSSSAGALEECTWDLLGDERAWLVEQQAHDHGREVSEAGAPAHFDTERVRGINIQLKYEKATYSALLLRDPAWSDSVQPGFSNLPLLLVRLPAHIREIVLEYITTTFDARISSMKLRPSFLGSCLDEILAHFAKENDFKPVQIQLAFPTAIPSLKNLDVAIAAADISSFIAIGKGLQTSLSGSNPRICGGPFMAALSRYLEEHIALSLEAQGVVLSKVACGPIALAGEGRVKLLASSLSTSDDENLSQTSSVLHEFYCKLLQEATKSEVSADPRLERSEKRSVGMDIEQGVDLVETVARTTMTGKFEDGFFIPADPPPPYELHSSHGVFP